jgi:hypothetical protein
MLSRLREVAAGLVEKIITSESAFLSLTFESAGLSSSAPQINSTAIADCSVDSDVADREDCDIVEDGVDLGDGGPRGNGTDQEGEPHKSLVVCLNYPLPDDGFPESLAESECERVHSSEGRNRHDSGNVSSSGAEDFSSEKDWLELIRCYIREDSAIVPAVIRSGGIIVSQFWKLHIVVFRDVANGLEFVESVRNRDGLKLGTCEAVFSRGMFSDGPYSDFVFHLVPGTPLAEAAEKAGFTSSDYLVSA